MTDHTPDRSHPNTAEPRVAIQVVRRRLGDEFREPAEFELSAGVTSPPVSGVRGLPLTLDALLR